MSYSRIAPNIKPYPLQSSMSSDTSRAYQCRAKQYQQENGASQPFHHQPIYRPAYRRIPYTTSISSQSSNGTFASILPEPAPIIVPSQQFLFAYPTFPLPAQQNPQHLRTGAQPSNPTPHSWCDNQSTDRLQHLPAYSVLEDATFSPVPHVQQAYQKELVKDVFFSPAFTVMHDSLRRESSQSDWSSSSSSSAHSDAGSEIMPSSIYSDNVQQEETPSNLLYGEDSHRSNDILGFELGSESLLILDQKQEDEEGKSHKDENTDKKRPSFRLSAFDTINDRHNAHGLPTPPGSLYTSVLNKFTQTKRRCSDSAVQENQHTNKKSRKANSVNCTAFTASTLPNTPSSTWECEFDFDEYDYFATVEGNNDSQLETSGNRLSVEQSRFGNAFSGAAAINSANDVYDDDDDIFSITSLDVEERALSVSGATTEEEAAEPSQPYTLNQHSSFQNSSTHQEHIDTINDNDDFVKVPPRPTSYPTIYQKLTRANIDWCRYCGTTEGVNWRPGPWGKRTLCNKHGCDYKGYGFACKLPRLNLTEFIKEKLNDRERPVLQLYCSVCQRKDSWKGNILVRCEGCPKAYHQKCCPDSAALTDEFVSSQEAWFCDETCCENARRKKIIVELPRKRLPLMSSPTSNNTIGTSISALDSTTVNKLQDSACQI